MADRLPITSARVVTHARRAATRIITHSRGTAAGVVAHSWSTAAGIAAHSWGATTGIGHDCVLRGSEVSGGSVGSTESAYVLWHERRVIYWGLSVVGVNPYADLRCEAKGMKRGRCDCPLFYV